MWSIKRKTTLVFVWAVAALCGVGTMAQPAIGQASKVPDFSGRWVAVVRESTGPAALGPSVEIRQDVDRFSLLRRVPGQPDHMWWSCSMDGADCTNVQENSSYLPTAARIATQGGNLVIDTNASDTQGRHLRVRRTISLNKDGEMVVETKTTGDARRDSARTVYRFFGK